MRLRQRLLGASAIMLFLELSLIRWLGASIVHLSYFSNFVLLGSFLGIGLGFLRAAAPDAPDRPLPIYSVLALIALVGFVSAFPVTINRTGSQLLFFSSLSTSGPPIWLVLPAVFLAVAVVFAGPGEVVGSCFRQLPRLEAYRLDLIGSLLGTATFTLLSFVDAPPFVWFVIVSVAFACYAGRRAAGVAAIQLVAIAAMFGYPLVHNTNTFWSPYYEVQTTSQAGAFGPEWTISVNGVPHQRLTSAAARAAEEPWYLQTYQQLPRTPKNALIVGAGTGTDVALALRQGVQHIDAVEIDPALLRFGRQHNPDRVYNNPRVTTHIDDGRAYLESTNKHYDLIIFALPDSLTLVSGASSLRLESYLFTKQAVEAARSHLAPGGAFSMYNFYREQWLVDRFAGTIDDVFGHAPCVYEQPSASALAVLTAGLTQADQQCTQTWHRNADTPPPATDDRPFPYLKDRTIPPLYLAVLLMILLGSALAVLVVLFANGAGRVAGGLTRQLRDLVSYADLALLGAAFLLLETKNVTGFALLFGTTWTVNALVFAGVLLAVLAAVELTARVRRIPLGVAYAGLLAALALSWVTPANWLLSLGVPLRALVAITLAFLPIFIANVIFATRFAQTSDAPLAFAANLLGAIVGGCLEYLALITGYRMLLVVAAALYTLAFVARAGRRARPQAAGQNRGRERDAVRARD